MKIILSLTFAFSFGILKYFHNIDNLSIRNSLTSHQTLRPCLVKVFDQFPYTGPHSLN